MTRSQLRTSVLFCNHKASGKSKPIDPTGTASPLVKRLLDSPCGWSKDPTSLSVYMSVCTHLLSPGGVVENRYWVPNIYWSQWDREKNKTLATPQKEDTITWNIPIPLAYLNHDWRSKKRFHSTPRFIAQWIVWTVTTQAFSGSRAC